MFELMQNVHLFTDFVLCFSKTGFLIFRAITVFIYIPLSLNPSALPCPGPLDAPKWCVSPKVCILQTCHRPELVSYFNRSIVFFCVPQEVLSSGAPEHWSQCDASCVPVWIGGTTGNCTQQMLEKSQVHKYCLSLACTCAPPYMWLLQMLSSTSCC